MLSKHSVKSDTHSIIKVEVISFFAIRPGAGSPFQNHRELAKGTLRALICEALEIRGRPHEIPAWTDAQMMEIDDK